jgi:serine/threonine protein kinase
MNQASVTALPEEICGYRIVERLGTSGLSAVFRASRPVAGTTVALRVLQPQFEGDPGAIAAFCHHARSAAALDHPSAAKVLDMHLDSPPYYFAMQYMAGGTLAERLRPGGLPAGETVAMWVQLCAAVGHAHELDIAHGDITPWAILFDGEGNPVLTGFGLSREMAVAAAMGIGDGRRTATYAPPEQLRGCAESKRGDTYSLAAVLYEALTGSPPLPEAIGRKRGLPPASATNPSVGPRLDAVVRRGLATRWFRYPNASKLSEALFDALGNPSPDVTSRRRVRRLLSAAAVAVSIIGVVSVFYSGSRKPGQVTSHATPYSPLGPEVHATGERMAADFPSAVSDEAGSAAHAAPAQPAEQRRTAADRSNRRSAARRAPEASSQTRRGERGSRTVHRARARSRPESPAKAGPRQKAQPRSESAGPVI